MPGNWDSMLPGRVSTPWEEADPQVVMVSLLGISKDSLSWWLAVGGREWDTEG